MSYRHCIGFFFNEPAPTEIYTLSLLDALPILGELAPRRRLPVRRPRRVEAEGRVGVIIVLHVDHHRRADLLHVREAGGRSEEHTSELQSRQYLVCRLLLEKTDTRQNFAMSESP